MNATIASLFVYPVKSCRGIELATARMTERGIAHDREWLIVDDAGRFITQREVPRLALIVPVLLDGALQLSAPGLSIAILPTKMGSVATSPCGATRCLPSIKAMMRRCRASAWIGKSVRLVRFDPRRGAIAIRNSRAPAARITRSLMAIPFWWCPRRPSPT